MTRISKNTGTATAGLTQRGLLRLALAALRTVVIHAAVVVAVTSAGLEFGRALAHHPQLFGRQAPAQGGLFDAVTPTAKRDEVVPRVVFGQTERGVSVVNRKGAAVLGLVPLAGHAAAPAPVSLTGYDLAAYALPTGAAPLERAAAPLWMVLARVMLRAASTRACDATVVEFIAARPRRAFRREQAAVVARNLNSLGLHVVGAAMPRIPATLRAEAPTLPNHVRLGRENPSAVPTGRVHATHYSIDVSPRNLRLDGNLRLDKRSMRYDVLTGEALAEAKANGEKLYLSHFATCPARQQFRKSA